MWIYGASRPLDRPSIDSSDDLSTSLFIDFWTPILIYSPTYWRIFSLFSSCLAKLCYKPYTLYYPFQYTSRSHRINKPNGDRYQRTPIISNLSEVYFSLLRTNRLSVSVLGTPHKILSVARALFNICSRRDKSIMLKESQHGARIRKQ